MSKKAPPLPVAPAKPEVYPTEPILVVDDEEQALLGCQIVLRTSGFTNVKIQSDSRKVLPQLASEAFSVLVCDLWMPHQTGEEILRKVRAEYPDLPVIILTGENDLETAIGCMRAGAFDYLLKPVDRNRLISSLHRATQFREIQRENQMLKQHILTGEVTHGDVFAGILTVNPRMKSIFGYIEAVAPSLQPVLIHGETGVGKELMARAIHKMSKRKGQFIAINLAGLDDNVFSDTLFGHKKGAFTGAEELRKGLVEVAAGGTLFMDEIGDLAMASQVKLLRLLQEREYYPIGSDTAKRAEARFIVATNQHLETMIKEGRFRRDLYYRLQTHQVAIPPLRDRKEDLPLLVQHFVEQAAQQLGKPIPRIPPELYTLLSVYHFPGNIRELEGIIFDAVSKNNSKTISLQEFRDRVFASGDAGQSPLVTDEAGGAVPLKFAEKLPTLKAAAALLVQEAMKRARNNQTIAAQMLGITQQALSKRLRAKPDEDE